MPFKEGRAPYNDKRLRNQAEHALLLSSKFEAQLEIGATALLENLWVMPREYVYNGATYVCRYPEIPEPGQFFHDGAQPDQMTFLQVSASEEIQRVRESLITEVGVRESLTSDDGKAPSSAEVQKQLAINKEAWRDARAIYEMIYRSRVNRTQHPNLPLTPAEEAAEELFSTASIAASEVIIATNYAEFYAQIHQQANQLAKNVRAMEHVNALFKAAINYGVHHAANTLMDAFLGGPVFSTISSITTGHSWGVFKFNRILGTRSIFKGEAWGELVRDEQAFFEAYNRFGERINRQGGLVYTNSQTREKFKHGMGSGLPGVRDPRARALAFALFLHNPHRVVVDHIISAAFVREAGDYVLNNL